MIEITCVLSKFEGKLWGYHLPLPSDILELLQSDNRRLKVKFSGSDASFQCAIMYANTYPFILLNQRLVSSFNLSIDQQVHIEIFLDTSEFGINVPLELSELLYQDKEAAEYFHNLTKGKQRSLIYIVSKVKSTQSRLNKALAIADHLKSFKGQLNFKQLNERIKFYNNL